MLIHVGCRFVYAATYPTPAIFQVEPRPDGEHRIVQGNWESAPDLPTGEYQDLYGNRCRRITLPVGRTEIVYDGVVEVSGQYDDVDPEAPQMPVETIPSETLVYTLPSRYCLSDALANRAWELFGASPPGYRRVQAVCDWVHRHVQFEYGASNPLTSAVDVLNQGRGVCRDFAHLAVTFCRALNIPARYVFGYLPDIAVPPPDSPMDFCAWFEAFLGGRWWTFDPRNNAPRIGRVLIGRGRDALDVAMVTTYGGPALHEMTVWAEEAAEPAPATAIVGPSR